MIFFHSYSVAAFKDAIKAGADIIEFDVWHSRDGKVVVHHDKDFSRMCGSDSSQIIFETDYDNFPKIIPPKEQSSRCHLYTAEECNKIPLLETVLQSIPPSVAIIIEFKQNSAQLVADVRKLISGRRENTFWFSLDEKTNSRLRSSDFELPTITSIIGMLKTLVQYYSGLLPYSEMDDAVFGITVEEVSMLTIPHF